MRGEKSVAVFDNRSIFSWKRLGAAIGEKPEIAVIGGTALAEMPGFADVAQCDVLTPYGRISSPIQIGTINGCKVAFLSRHGIGHWLSPSEIPYAANMWALKMLGVRVILSVTACGSLRADIKPGDMVVIDQYIDRTCQRQPDSFFTKGIVAHHSFGQPVCEVHRKHLLHSATAAVIKKGEPAYDETMLTKLLSRVLHDPRSRSPLLYDVRNLMHRFLKRPGVRVHDGGIYLCMEGPVFSPEGQSWMYRLLAASVVGMTNLPEAKLARELGMCYVALGLSTDYDSWIMGQESVNGHMIMEVIKRNIDLAKEVIRLFLVYSPGSSNCNCCGSFAQALHTQVGKLQSKEARQAFLEARERLLPVLGETLPQAPSDW